MIQTYHRTSTILIVISAAVTILARYMQWTYVYYAFKPLTMILILSIALIGTTIKRRYKYPIVAGLIFSLIGDVLLMLPSDPFIAGLSSFLIAHICYIAAFTSDAPFAKPLWPFVILIGIATLLVFLLWPGLSATLRPPVIAYASAIAVMSAQAICRSQHHNDRFSKMAAYGAIIFFLSDAILAVDRFRNPFPASYALILLTYYFAQWLIARSMTIVQTPASNALA